MRQALPLPISISLDTIQSLLPKIDVFETISKGFIAYSKGEAVIPPVGELLFEQPPGEVHIKYGYIKTAPYYVIKVASGFYNNPSIGLPSSQGLNLLFDKTNGQLVAILLDEGHLTDVRTAVAGAISSRALAPSQVHSLGIIGAGTQALLQWKYHRRILDFSEVLLWNRHPEKAQQLAETLRQQGAKTKVVEHLEDLARQCQLIVTTTPSSTPLLEKNWIQPGTHITAIGADMPHKMELDPQLVASAELVVVDSRSQTRRQGEWSQALRAGLVKDRSPLELGEILANPQLGRQNDQQLTIADLTGVAVQDLMISQAIFENIK
ncbi:MAG: ornithine cyclodeaminase family protein [Saprospiraceae bacterium]|nr:ornithine cyclodeaminase family protein [Saprospiraceae bacterium]